MGNNDKNIGKFGHQSGGLEQRGYQPTKPGNGYQPTTTSTTTSQPSKPPSSGSSVKKNEN